jgi:hypothetical protein
MNRLLRWYGSGPLHLLAMLASFAVAGYAALRMAADRPVVVVGWLVGAAVAHDLLLLPLYAVADRSLLAVWRHRRGRLPAVPWLNYIRVPALLSGLLLLVWFPSIFRFSRIYSPTTALSSDGYLERWLLITAGLFALSALALAVRLRTARR